VTDEADLCYTPAQQLAASIRSRQLSPLELVEAVLRRIAALDGSVHAFLTVDADGALEAAREAEAQVMRDEELKPLHGIPVSVKDLEPVAGIRLTFGSRFFENNVAGVDGAAAGRLRSAGAIILGKTNTPAFGHKDMCDNLLMEATRNPWNLDRTSGASSGGAAAAVAAGFGPIAHGTDGAGSIRIPAALCGIFGMKPSFGRVPVWPNLDYWNTRTHVGPMARTVGDAALMLSVMAGADERDPLSIDAPADDYAARAAEGVRELRVGWSPNLGRSPIDPEVLGLAEAAALRFVELGCQLEPATPRWDDPTGWHGVIYRAGLAVTHAQKLRERPEWVDPTLAAIIEAGLQLTLPDLVRAQQARARFYDQARAFMEPYDLVLTPAMPCVAWSHERPPREVGGHEVQAMAGGRWPLMFPFNVTGWPAATVPCGFTAEGLPAGLQIVARWRQDARCLQAAAAFEAAQPWAAARPPVRARRASPS
jgi:Asp-tRNA(Asn)/Glu-tRNA(Gln) amidotransferase A subunit family amidase